MNYTDASWYGIIFVNIYTKEVVVLELKDECAKIYKKIYTTEYELQSKKKRKLEKNRKKDARNKALDETYIKVLMNHSAEIDEGKLDSKDVWEAISMVHKKMVADLDSLGIDPDQQEKVIEQVESSRQSWVRASGLSFERYIASTVNPLLKKKKLDVELKSPSEVKKLVEKNLLGNDPEDIKFISKWDESFDLYAIQKIAGTLFVIGCIQAKTSIRERVGNDYSHSQQAMNRHFWSVAITLDGEFLGISKYINMVNGNKDTIFLTNGWHGMYALSRVNDNGRIYKLDKNLNLFVNHLEQALKKRIAGTANFDSSWIAK